MTEKNDRLMDAYAEIGGSQAVWAAIGQIMGTFASVESQVSMHLMETLGYQFGDPIGEAIVGGMSLDEMWRLLKRAMEARNLPDHSMKYVDDLKKYIGMVKRYRNIFAHNQFSFREDDKEKIIIVFNLHNQKHPKRSSFYEITKAELDACVQHSSACAGITGTLHGATIGMDVAAVNDMLAVAVGKMGELPPLPEADSGYRFR